ncbi:MAG: PAS domain S-box protein, partial [Thermodesulfobacteriota bacterium]|nr:PAS domain S-box protein [Thermodesulfobacteriota bacterium]
MNERRDRTILESIDDGYYETDFAGNFTFFNDSLCKILGYPEDELMGMNYKDYMDQEDAKKVYEAFKRVHMEGDTIRIIDWEIKRKDGSRRHIEASAGSLTTDREGRGIGFRGIMRDVTERKQTEVELIQTRNFLQNILDSSIDGTTTTDIEGRITYVTPRAMEMLGYKHEEVIDKRVSTFYGSGIEDAGEIMKELMAKGELRDHEMNLMKKNGDLLDINLSASLLRNEKNEVIGTLGICRDISEKKILEAQLIHAQKMESVGILAGGIAHDFNNILQAISGYVQLLLMKKKPDDPDRNYLNQIEKSSQRAADLIKQLLIFSRKVESKLMPLNLNGEVEQVFKLLGRTLPRMVDIELRLSSDLDFIRADPIQLEQIMMNLGVNAGDAMPHGGKLIFKTENIILDEKYCKVHMGSKPGEYVLLSISDTGQGMGKET